MIEGLDPFNTYETGKIALQEAVVADGGLEGLFDKLRAGQFDEIFERYDRLLKAAASPEDRQRRRAENEATGMSADERLDRTFMEVASVDGLDPDDVPAMLLAVKLCNTAFPGIPVDEIPGGVGS